MSLAPPMARCSPRPREQRDVQLVLPVKLRCLLYEITRIQSEAYPGVRSMATVAKMPILFGRKGNQTAGKVASKAIANGGEFTVG